MSSTTKEARDSGAGAIQFLLFVVLFVIVLHFGRELMIPLVAAAFLSMLMAPVCRWLEKKLKRPFAVLLCVLILVIGVLGIFAIIVGEISSFSDDLPAIEKKSNQLLKSVEQTIQEQFGVEQERQVAMAKEQLKSIGTSTGSYLGRMLGSVTGVLGSLVIMMVYTFLLLFHRERYEIFFIKLFGKKDPEKAKEIIENVTNVGQHYIKGRTLSVIILWFIYAGGFMIFGLKTSILLGGIVAILSIIPYVGGIIGGIFPVFMALTTDSESSTTLWGVAFVLFFAHALSTYIIEPLVVGSRLKLSALSMIVVIIAANAIWGIAGMILFVPILSMAKIIFDHIPHLQPYGYLISDPDEGKVSVIGSWVEKIFSRKKRKIAGKVSAR